MKMLRKRLVAKSLAWLSGVLMLLVIGPPLVGAVLPPAMSAAPTATASAAQSLAATAPKEIDTGANAFTAQQEVAFNLVGLYALQGIAAKAMTQLEFCRANGKLPNHWREDEDLDDLRKSVEYQSWVMAHFPYDPGPKS